VRSGSRAVRVLLAVAWFCGCGAPRVGSPVSTANQPPASAPAVPLRRVPLGLCEDYPEETRSLEEVRRDLAVLRAAGVDVLRVSMGWDGLEPEKDRYDFAFWDAFVDVAVRTFGIRLIPYVAYTPRWDSDGTPEAFWKTPPRDTAEFAEIMGLLAARYRGRIHSWELWNEPDNRDYWLGSAAEYAALLAAGSAAVRRAAPEARVVSGGLAGGVPFLRELFDEHGSAEHVDIVNLHAYYETWNPNPLEVLPEYLDEVSAIVRRHGGRQALWLAEVGYSDFRAPAGGPSAPYEHTPDFQAVMLVRTLALAYAHPALSLVAWYELKDPGASAPMIGDDHNRHLGVTFVDGTRKPAFAALAFTQSLFSQGFAVVDAELDIERRSPSDVELRGFVTARRTLVVVAWLRTHGSHAPSDGADARRESVRVGAPYARSGPARVYDERGRSVDAKLREHAGARVDFTLELAAGEVRVVEQALAR
jgi:hypothetical protein